VQLTFQFREYRLLQIECGLCNQAETIGFREMHQILAANLCPDVINTEDFDEHWTANMFGQVVWQLACYHSYFKLSGLLTVHNVLH
jgi:hypothetical protein